MAIKVVKSNAIAIDKDMEWLTHLTEVRLKFFLGEETKLNLEETVPPPEIDTDSEYHIFVKNFNFEERLVFALAMMMHIRPELLDALLIPGARNGNIYTEFGGVTSPKHRGFIPTGDTALFLLGCNSTFRKFQVSRLFDTEHFFSKNEILRLADVENGMPSFGGEVLLYPGILELVTTGVKYQPKYSEDFPAVKLTTNRGWGEKVFNRTTENQLDEVKNWINYSDSMRSEWGLDSIVKPGYRCLFYGPPGTGKTFTCTLLGSVTNKNVYRIDLSLLVSKYVGETIKNLEKTFKHVGNEILFFDEADALFGKRTKVNDAHDRFANQEVSYLLQRIEEFDGVVILASNLKDNIDDAFMRRFQTVVYFPVPEQNEREKLWKISFPKIKPENNKLYKELGEKYELSGGNITNAAHYAAILAYTRIENAKIELPSLKKQDKKTQKRREELIAMIETPCIIEGELNLAIRKEYGKEGKSFPREKIFFQAP